ncbi:hypothetical protein BLAT2472_60156 [Burkholderia latens]
MDHRLAELARRPRGGALARRAIDRFIGRLLESAGTARQPRAAAITCPLIRLSRKPPCSRL